ncbi:95_t:CDS:2 [Ambispora leptoticha]|uniref:95_t:CDS:1 n=1 Tax=Ambispora leptoticha TaxID=144679 RepID=A0A9N9ARU5_9GLOM|nr:95_t:CDS:2 [Ambispora leptoticha]
MYFAPTSNITSINNNHQHNTSEQQSQVLISSDNNITPLITSDFEDQPNNHLYNFTTVQQQQIFPTSPISSPSQPTISSSNTHLVNNPNTNRLFVPSPPLSPMNTSALGSPNRSCSSCKKRKVKCDRKTPSCSACIKSKNRCLYTSYSPPAAFLNQSSPSSLSSPTFSQLRENDQQVESIKSENELENEHFNLYNNEEIIMEDRSEELIKSLHERLDQIENIGRQRFEHIQKIQQQSSQLSSLQQTQFPYLLADDDAAMLKLIMENPIVPQNTSENYLSTSVSELIPNTVQSSDDNTSIINDNSHPTIKASHSSLSSPISSPASSSHIIRSFNVNDSNSNSDSHNLKSQNHHGPHSNSYSPYSLPQHHRSFHRQMIPTTPLVSIKAKSILGPRIAPILNAITTIHLIRDVSQPNDNIVRNGNLNFPVETGFKHLQHLQHWIQDRFQTVVNELSSGNLNKEITDEILKVGVEKLELRPIMKERIIENGNGLVESNAYSQLFEMIFYRRRQKDKDDFPIAIKSEPMINEGKGTSEPEMAKTQVMILTTKQIHFHQRVTMHIWKKFMLFCEYLLAEFRGYEKIPGWLIPKNPMKTKLVLLVVVVNGVMGQGRAIVNLPTEHAGYINFLQHELNELKKEFEGASDQNFHLSESIDELQGDIADYENHTYELEARISELEDENKNLKQEFDELHNQYGRFQFTNNTLNHYENQIKTLRYQAEELQYSVDELETQNEWFKRHTENLYEANQKLRVNNELLEDKKEQIFEFLKDFKLYTKNP